MSGTGTYKWCKEKQKVIKISDRVRLRSSVGRVDEAYYDVGLDTVVRNANHKRELLKQRGLHIVEKGEGKGKWKR